MKLRKIEKIAIKEAEKLNYLCGNDIIWKNFKEAKEVTSKLVEIGLLKRVEDKHGVCYELTDAGKEIAKTIILLTPVIEELKIPA